MTAGTHAKYLFDNDFGLDEGEAPRAQGEEGDVSADESAATEPQDEVVEAEVVEEVPPPPVFSEDDVARARAEGQQAGRDEATRDMASAMEQRVANTLDAINTQVANLFDAYAMDKDQHSRDAVAVATVIVRKLFPALNMDKAMDEIEHMIVEAMKRTSGNPTLIIRAPKDMHQEIADKAKELAALRGHEGTITVVVDETIATGDIAVEWDGGGMTRDTNFIWREVDEIIERNLGQKVDHNPSADAPEPLQSSPAQEPQQAQKPEPEAEQLVVKPSQVGENEEIPVESPQTEGETTESTQTQDEPED